MRLILRLLTLTTLTWVGVVHAAKPKPAEPRLIVTINLATSDVLMEKITNGKRQKEWAKALPIARGSLRRGTYAVSNMRSSYPTANGNVYLENVIYFAGHTIRTTHYYNYLHQQGRPMSGAVVLNGDFGGFLYGAIKHFKTKNTTVIVN